MCVFDVYIVEADKEYYNGIHPHKILFQHERCKKGKYIETCLE